MTVKLSSLVVFVGLMMALAGAILGLSQVNVGADCGPAWTSASTTYLTADGTAACDAARSSRLATSLALAIPGGLAFVTGIVMGVREKNEGPGPVRPTDTKHAEV